MGPLDVRGGTTERRRSHAAPRSRVEHRGAARHARGPSAGSGRACANERGSVAAVATIEDGRDLRDVAARRGQALRPRVRRSSRACSSTKGRSFTCSISRPTRRIRVPSPTSGTPVRCSTSERVQNTNSVSSICAKSSRRRRASPIAVAPRASARRSMRSNARSRRRSGSEDANGALLPQPNVRASRCSAACARRSRRSKPTSRMLARHLDWAVRTGTFCAYEPKGRKRAT